MHNDLLEKRIEKTYERDLFEKEKAMLKAFAEDKERTLNEIAIEKPLSEYSTTQLKAELRRRKRKGGGSDA